MDKQIPLVDYLVLGDDPHLTANECTACGARFFDRRNACASCGKTEFKKVDIATKGEVKAFTIVAFAAPGVPVPYVAALVDCGGTSVRANLINVEPDPEHVTLGMKVQLATQVIGTDDNGTDAIGFGFEPMRRLSTMASDDLWILGIHMTKFGKHPEMDLVDLASEAVLGALADGGVGMKDMGVIGAGNLMAANAGIGQQVQKQLGQTGIPVFNVANACATGCHGTAGGLHGGQGRRGRHGPGLRGGEALRSRTPLRRQPEGGFRHVQPVGSLRGGRAGRRANRHGDHARRLRPDRDGVRPSVRRDQLRALRQDQREEPLTLDAQSAGGLPRRR